MTVIEALPRETHGAMEEVRLATRDGKLVHWVMLPPFRTMPEVIQWGARHFQKGERLPTGDYEYREVFTYTCPMGTELRQKTAAEQAARDAQEKDLSNERA